MNRRIFVAGLLFLLTSVVALTASAQETLSASNYRLDSGDHVKIQVYGEPELSVETRLSDAGTVIYPFLGELRLAGKTIGQVERQITEGLQGDYLVDPRVTVMIVEYRQFYVRGEVKNPGGFPYRPGLTVEKAITVAGGFTERASRKKIFVTSETGGRDSLVKVDYDTPVRPGDVILVEESFF